MPTNGLALIDLDRSLLSYVDRVLLARDVSRDYAAKVRYCNRRFCKWLGCDPGIDGLDAGPVNEFLAHLKDEGKRPDTVLGYRRAILVVWNQAYVDGDNDNPPLRVRKIRTSRDPVDAFTHEEIIALLKYVASVKGYFPNGVRRADFWTAAINAAYSTGLRRGDLLKLKRNQIGDRGVCHVRQNKTGYPITVRLSPDALAAIWRMNQIEDERALPWPYHENAMGRQFRRLAKSAGVRAGQFKWLRRSAGSYAERENRGDGKRMLGHRSERVFREFYEDRTITEPEPVEPPRLE